VSAKDWRLVGAVAVAVGAVVAIHGVTSRRWRQAHTLAVVLSALAAVGPYMKSGR
jgi:hypothetical protein